MKRKAITDGGQPSKKTEKEPGICKAIGEFAQIEQENGVQSPLLRLPAEIRHGILTLLIGNKRIHILPSDRNRDPNLWKPEAFGHLLCHQSGFDNLPCVKPDSRQKFDASFSHCEPFHRVHLPCDLKRSHTHVNNDEYLHLSLLRTSRQMYADGTTILWATNMFSFTTAGTFKAFMDKLRIYPNSKLQHLSLGTLVREAGCRAIEILYDYKPEGDMRSNYGSHLVSWGLDCDKSWFLHPLRSLRTLEICIHYIPTLLELRPLGGPLARDGSEFTFKTLRSQFPYLRSFQMLQLQKLQVTITDEEPPLDCSDILPRRLTVTEKAGLAEEFRLQIMSRKDEGTLKLVADPPSKVDTKTGSASVFQKIDVSQEAVEGNEKLSKTGVVSSYEFLDFPCGKFSNETYH